MISKAENIIVSANPRKWGYWEIEKIFQAMKGCTTFYREEQKRKKHLHQIICPEFSGNTSYRRRHELYQLIPILRHGDGPFCVATNLTPFNLSQRPLAVADFEINFEIKFQF